MKKIMYSLVLIGFFNFSHSYAQTIGREYHGISGDEQVEITLRYLGENYYNLKGNGYSEAYHTWSIDAHLFGEYLVCEQRRTRKALITSINRNVRQQYVLCFTKKNVYALRVRFKNDYDYEKLGTDEFPSTIGYAEVYRRPKEHGYYQNNNGPFEDPFTMAEEDRLALVNLSDE